MLVDCDIHLGYDSLPISLPYLDPPTRELVLHSGSHGLAMPTYPWNHPTGWVRRRSLRRRRRQLLLGLRRRSPSRRFGTASRSLRRRHRDRGTGRSGGVLAPPQRTTSREALLRLQRVPPRTMAPGRATAAGDARRPSAVPAGGRRRDSKDGRTRRVRRRLPPRGGARPVRQPDVRPDLGGGQRTGASRGRSHAL